VLNPKKKFTHDLPTGFLDNDPRCDFLTYVWRQDVCSSINAIYKFYNSLLVNRLLRTTVFESKLHQVCTDFSRRTENVKIYFYKVPSSANTTDEEAAAAAVEEEAGSSNQDTHSKEGRRRRQRRRRKRKQRKKKVEYRLRLVKLSPMHAEQRNVQFCSADIPQRPPDPVHAQMIGMVHEDTVTATATITTAGDTTDEEEERIVVIITANDIVSEVPRYQQILVEDTDDEDYSENGTDNTSRYYYYNPDNPPLAAHVSTIDDEENKEEDDDPQPPCATPIATTLAATASTPTNQAAVVEDFESTPSLSIVGYRI
jgi:hypothetical protein